MWTQDLNSSSDLAIKPSFLTHHTFSPHRTGWFSVGRRVGRWPGPPGSSAQCQGSTHPLRRCPWAYRPSRSSSRYPPRHFHCHSSCWDPWRRLGSRSPSLGNFRCTDLGRPTTKRSKWLAWGVLPRGSLSLWQHNYSSSAKHEENAIAIFIYNGISYDIPKYFKDYYSFTIMLTLCPHPHQSHMIVTY